MVAEKEGAASYTLGSGPFVVIDKKLIDPS
jgi:hypothetical protein